MTPLQMKPRLLLLAALAAALAAALTLSAATAALAKGASAATIDGSGPGGPGNGPNGPITLRGDGEPGSGSALGTLADLSGLFPAMFSQSSDPMLEVAPTTWLGPRSTITWTIPDGSGTAKAIRQDVYPYAAGGPVTYTKPGQPVLDQTTRGGWYRASDGLRQQLISLGLPNKAPVKAPVAAASQPPGADAAGGSGGSGGSNASPAPARQAAAPASAATSASSSSSSSWPQLLAGGAVLLLLVVAGTTAIVLYRRLGPATTR